MLLLTALLLADAQAGYSSRSWTCTANHFIGVGGMSVSMSFWGPNKPIIKRPYFSISVRRFSYHWNPTPRLLTQKYRDPNEVGFPLRLKAKPRFGHVVLTARGERPVRIPMGQDALWTWDVWHGAYLRLKDGQGTSRLLSVPRWTATVFDRRGRVQEVTTIVVPARNEVRPLYDEARLHMLGAARDPERSPLCTLDPERGDEGDIVRLSGSGSSDPA